MDPFEAENIFYKECDPARLGKFIAHSKLYEMTLKLPGDFVEVGIFKGASFCRFRKLGRLHHPDSIRRFIGFDIFGPFPDHDWEADAPVLRELREIDGATSISKDELLEILSRQGLSDNVELIEGDVRETLPTYMEKNPYLALAGVNIDVDLYGPTKAALEALFPRVVKNGVVILDDYAGGFPGANRAVEEYLEENDRSELIQRFPLSLTPSFIVKN